MLFVLRLIEFTHLPDGVQQTPDTKVELPKYFFFASAIFIRAIPSCPPALQSLQPLNIALEDVQRKTCGGCCPCLYAFAPLPSRLQADPSTLIKNSAAAWQNVCTLRLGSSPTSYLAPLVFLTDSLVHLLRIGISGGRREATAAWGGWRKGGKVERRQAITGHREERWSEWDKGEES